MGIKRKFKYIFDINYIKSFKMNKKFQSLIFPKVHLKLRGSSKIFIDGNLRLGRTWDGARYLSSQLKVEKNCTFKVKDTFNIYSGFWITVDDGGELILGSGYINYNCNIACFDKIVIGNNVAISENVTIRDSDNHYLNSRNYKKSKPIIIKDNVWIGLNSTILKGVTIGEGSVVAAGSVVTRSVPDHCLVAGVPAKVIKKNVFWGNEKSVVDSNGYSYKLER